MDNARVQELVTQAGPLDDELLSVVAIDDTDSQWLLRFGEFDIMVDNLPEADKLVLSTIIGGPAIVAEDDAHRAMLAQNALWRETGGIRMALAAPGGAVEISLDVAASIATPARIAELATNLGSYARGWVTVFGGEVQDDTDAMADGRGMIRV